MTNSSSQRNKVGLFVIVGLVLAGFIVFLLGASKSLFVDYSHIFAKFDNVQGLNVGSTVSLAGVNIGNVYDIQFVPEEKMLKVDLKVDRKFLSRITEGSYVEIRTQGALGDKFIYIIPGDPKAAQLNSEKSLEASKSGDLLNLIAERSGDIGKFFDAISETQRLLRSLNEGGRIDSILGNFKETSTNMAKASTDLRQLIGDVSPKAKSATDKLDHILAKIDSGQGSLGALINDPSVHDQLKNILGANSQKKSIRSLLRNSIEKVKDE